MSALPPEAERLLAVEAGRFVEERKRLAAELRAEGRRDEAAAVAGLAKPSAVVLATNRAARDRPNVARDAGDAAERVGGAQVRGDADGYAAALAELRRSLDLLAEVADAHVAPGRRPSEAMRRRVRDLLRSAVADDSAREALRRGALTDEVESPGFASFAGVAPAPARRKQKPASRPVRTEKRRRERERALRDELAAAEERLRDAERTAREAERKRARAERAVETLRAKLERG